MAGSANILRCLSEPNRTPRLLQDALVHPTRARSSVTGSKDERLQQTAAKPQGECTRGPPPRGANPVGRPLISTRTRVKSAAAPCQACGVQGPLPRSFLCPIVGRATMSGSRRAGITQTRWFDSFLYPARCMHGSLRTHEEPLSMVTPSKERAASVVAGKQPILGWRQPLGAAVKSGELRDSITRGPSRSWVRMMRCPLSMSPIEPKTWKAAQAFAVLALGTAAQGCL